MSTVKKIFLQGNETLFSHEEINFFRKSFDFYWSIKNIFEPQ